MQEVEAHVGQPPLNLSLIEGAGFCHDATWTLAKALNNTINGNHCHTHVIFDTSTHVHLHICEVP